MDRQQIRDAEECKTLKEAGKKKDCIECSCNICLAQYFNKGAELEKERILEFAKTSKEIIVRDIKRELETQDELRGAKKILDLLVRKIKGYS